MSSDFEVPEPIICSPFEEPAEHWYIEEGRQPDRRPGRRPSVYFRPAQGDDGAVTGTAIPLRLVELVRARLKQWRHDGYPGASRTTLELLTYWRRDGRQHRLFFAQLEAAETVIFLNEARRDYLQGIDVPLDEPSDRQKEDLGYRAFTRYACKMATGAGKTTVMGMLAAWSILNKVHDRGNARYSDVVLVVCPNVTIRSRLGELDPQQGEASLDSSSTVDTQKTSTGCRFPNVFGESHRHAPQMWCHEIPSNTCH
jgi:type III restriction enzyme